MSSVVTVICFNNHPLLLHVICCNCLCSVIIPYKETSKISFFYSQHVLLCYLHSIIDFNNNTNTNSTSTTTTTTTTNNNNNDNNNKNKTNNYDNNNINNNKNIVIV